MGQDKGREIMQCSHSEENSPKAKWIALYRHHVIKHVHREGERDMAVIFTYVLPYPCDLKHIIPEAPKSIKQVFIKPLIKK